MIWDTLLAAFSQQAHSHAVPGQLALAISVCLTSTLACSAQTELDGSHLSSTLYFRSEADEFSSRAALHMSVSPEIKALKSASIKALPTELDRSEALIASLQTHAAFLKVRTLEDTQDQAARKARDEVSTDQSVLEAAMDTRLRRLPPRDVNSLGPYKFMARSAQHDATHALSPDAERYRGAIFSPTLNRFADAYNRLDGRLVRPKEMISADPVARRAALAKWNDAFDQAASEEAALLAGIVELENRDAAAQGYANAADRKYQERGLSDAQVEQTLAAVQAQAPAYRHYQEVVAAHAAAKLGVPFILSTELDLAGTHTSPISLSEARHLILSSLAPLGANYTTRFAALLDPANGRLDLAGGAHRANTGTSIAAFNAPTALYYGGYDGSLRQVSTIAHEGGHAIHRELMNVGGSPIYERSGPNYLFEGFAIFNELLLLDHASEVATSPEEKKAALEALLHKISLELFVSAEETAFEHSLYTESVGQPLLNRSKIDAMYRSAVAPYEVWPIKDVGQSRGWMRKSLVFEDPLYLVNYLYASVKPHRSAVCHEICVPASAWIRF